MCTAAGTPYSMASPAIATTAETLRTALICVTCILVLVSIVIFIIEFICGHCFSQRWRKSSEKKDDESPSNISIKPNSS